MTASVFDHVDTVYDQAKRWYLGYIQPEDLRSELVVYATENRRRLEKWIEKGEDYRVSLALRGVAKTYGATEKARALGYEYDDCAWYSPHGLVSLLVLALDPTWDGLTGESDNPGGSSSGGEGGTLIAMVMDVRRVLSRHSFHGGWDPETQNGWDNLERLSELLGGAQPWAPGYRRRSA